MKAETKRGTVEILKIAAILTLIAVIAGAVLGVVHHYTKIDAEETLSKKLAEIYPSQSYRFLTPDASAIENNPVLKNGSVKTVCVPDDNTKTFVMICEGKGAYKSTLSIYLVITDYTIKALGSYSNQETPGLGSKALEESYLSLYIGKNVKDTVFVFGAEIDAVTGATKTSAAVKNAVNCGILYYNTFAESAFEGGL